MRHKPILLIIALLIALPLYAQNKISFGFKGGITLSQPAITSVYDNPQVDARGKAGINIGAYIDCIQTGSLTISSELYYCSKKADINLTYRNYSGTLYGVTASESTDYLIYGITGKLMIDAGYFRPYVFAEPRLNFYLGDELTTSDPLITQGVKKSVSDNMKRFGFGFNLGAGIDFMNSKYIHTFIEAQICPDLFNSFDNDDYKVKSTPVEIRLGIGF